MTPNLNLAIQNHNHSMSDWWRKPEYIRERKAYVKRNPVCCRCGRKCQTPGHSWDDYQHGFEHYLQRVIDDDCDPLCSVCNGNEKKSRKPCPSCVKIFHATGEKIHIHYIPQDRDLCFDCQSPEVKARSLIKREEFQQFVRRIRDADNARRREAYQERKRGMA